MTDAGFHDGREAPLNLGAFDAEGLAVISALAQDGVFPASEMRWDRGRGRFAILLNRVRWEDTGAARHVPERVQSVLSVSHVTGVASQGVPKGDADTILSLLSMEFVTIDAPAGDLTLTLAGDGGLRLTVEALEVNLRDVTRPYEAPSGKLPHHDV